MALSLDGTPVTGANVTGTFATGTLTTSAGFGQIVVAIATNAASVSSVTATGLVFTQRGAGWTSGFGTATGQEWVAPYTSNFSGVITITLSSNVYGQACAWAIGGANTNTPFDSNVSLPAISASSTATGTTSNANDFVYAIAASTSTDTPGAGWTLVASASSLTVEYQIVSATGSFTSNTGSGPVGSIVDAIIQGSSPITPSLMAQSWM